MKGFILISLALFATVGQISAQSNPLLDVLDRVTEVYNEYEEFKHDSRFAMGDHIRHLSQLVLNVVLEEITSWGLRVKQQCPHLRNTEAQGEIVRGCAESAVVAIAAHQDAIFDILEDMNDASNAVSLSTVEELVEFNVITNYDDFNSHFDPIITEFRSRLTAYVAQVGQEIAGLAGITSTLPDTTRACINAAFQKFLQTC
ncbi:uncharacterized protein LOC129786764 [Lutzomyia longipalpis]|uniref:uncharacterized protein LOC129786764 n=1 Tax=Lutzomyia longipalpis TaxID=7200 RepID=UPI0024845559|nr:uncharacterized protein LOC129786764 [Lutzomyia longipalpis]